MQSTVTDPVHGPNRPVVAIKPNLSPSDVHVLLVDDERLSRTIVSNLLRKCSYTVTTAADGAEALELLRRHTPGTFHLVLTDVCMPEVNGIQLLRYVKADDTLRSVPVVMMSSIEQGETVYECVQGGADEYLVKPVTRKEVQHIWQHVWRKQQAAAHTVPQVTADQQQNASGSEAQMAPVTQNSDMLQNQHQHGGDEKSQTQQLPQQQVKQVSANILTSVVETLATVVEKAPSASRRADMFVAVAECIRLAHLKNQALQRVQPSSLMFGLSGGKIQFREIVSTTNAVVTTSESISNSNFNESQVEEYELYAMPAVSAPPSASTTDALSAAMQANMYALGLIGVDLLFPCSTAAARSMQLRAARNGVLPPKLAAFAAHSTIDIAPLQDLLGGLLHSNPAQRPTIHEVKRSGVLDLVAVLGREQRHLFTCPAPPSVDVDNVGSTQQAATTTAAERKEESGLTRPPPSRAPEPNAEDYEAARNFLRLMKEARLAEAEAVQKQLEAIELDTNWVVARMSQSQGHTFLPSSSSRQRDEEESEGEGNDGAKGREAKRRRVTISTDTPLINTTTTTTATNIITSSKGSYSSGVVVDESAWLPLASRAPVLDALYFTTRPAAASSTCARVNTSDNMTGSDGAFLDDFASDLGMLANSSKLEMVANVRCGSLATPHEMVCCADMDAEDRHFATASVARCVKIFSFDDVLEAPGNLHYPVWQATSRSKLSCVTWNHYMRSHILTSDYDGLIQLWDAASGQGAEAAQFDEHSRRVWSVDFSRLDPLRFVSGSDDGTVRIWNANEDSSGLRMRTPANVCCVQWHPTNGNIVAAGCANHKVYLYDLRRPEQAVATLEGPRRAVSYVRFVDGNAVVAASTDSTVRMWELSKHLGSTNNSNNASFTKKTNATDNLSAMSNGRAVGGSSSGNGRQPDAVFTGHTNERNFVGLSVSQDGHIACGSEDNMVYTYYKKLPFSTSSHSFDSPAVNGGGKPSKAFVSAVCWTREGRHCLAANSQGQVRVLQLQ